MGLHCARSKFVFEVVHSGSFGCFVAMYEIKANRELQLGEQTHVAAEASITRWNLQLDCRQQSSSPLRPSVHTGKRKTRNVSTVFVQLVQPKLFCCSRCSHCARHHLHHHEVQTANRKLNFTFTFWINSTRPACVTSFLLCFFFGQIAVPYFTKKKETPLD